MLSAYFIRSFANVYKVVLEAAPILFTVLERNGIYKDMIVQVIMVYMRCKHNLVLIGRIGALFQVLFQIP